MEEAERAVRELDGRELRGHTVTLRLQDSVSTDNYAIISLFTRHTAKPTGSRLLLRRSL